MRCVPRTATKVAPASSKAMLSVYEVIKAMSARQAFLLAFKSSTYECAGLWMIAYRASKSTYEYKYSVIAVIGDATTPFSVLCRVINRRSRRIWDLVLPWKLFEEQHRIICDVMPVRSVAVGPCQTLNAFDGSLIG